MARSALHLCFISARKTLLVGAVLILTPPNVDAAPRENPEEPATASEGYKTPFTRFLELPGRFARGVENIILSGTDSMGKALDSARGVRDEIYRDGLGEFVDKRMNNLGRGVMDTVDGAAWGAGDLAHGRAAQVADKPEAADDALLARREATRNAADVVEKISTTVEPTLAPTRKAVEIVSNPNAFDRSQAVANWLDASARELAKSAMKSANGATKTDVQQQVREQLRERIRKMPPAMWEVADKALDAAVGNGVDVAFSVAGSAANRAVAPSNVSAKSAAPARIQLSGVSPWDHGNANQFCTMAGTIDVTAGRWKGQALHGGFRKVAGQTFTGEFEGTYSGDAQHGTLTGGGAVTIFYRDSQTGRPKSSVYRYPVQATLVGGVVTGTLFDREGHPLYRFSLPVK